MAKQKAKLSLLQKRMRTGYLFILPWLVGFILFYVRSLIMTGQFAFSNMEMDTVNGGYILTPAGFENFRNAFMVHGSFKQTLTTSVMNMLIDVPLITFFSLFMAILLNKKFPGRFAVRALFFLPVILSSGVILGVEYDNPIMAEMRDVIEMNGGDAISITDTIPADPVRHKVFIFSRELFYQHSQLPLFLFSINIISYFNKKIKRK